jgi:uncharacterized repeat protein (TIGR02543 family)
LLLAANFGTNGSVALANTAATAPLDLSSRAADATFNLRDYYYMPSETQTLRTGLCWAFSLNGMLESFLQRNFGVYTDLSEGWLGVVNYKEYGDPNDYADGGYWVYDGDEFINNYGFLLEEQFPLETYVTAGIDGYQQYIEKYGDLADKTTLKVSVNYEYKAITPLNYVDDLKHYIACFGAAAIGVFSNGGYYNLNTEADYTGTAYFRGADGVETTHTVNVIGWDDNYVIPDSDSRGAWLCQNTWGSDFDSELCYVMYDDPSTLATNEVSKIDALTYNGYQYDFSVSAGENYTRYTESVQSSAAPDLYLQSTNSTLQFLDGANVATPINVFDYNKVIPVLNFATSEGAIFADFSVYLGQSDVTHMFGQSISNECLKIRGVEPANEYPTGIYKVNVNLYTDQSKTSLATTRGFWLVIDGGFAVESVRVATDFYLNGGFIFSGATEYVYTLDKYQNINQTSGGLYAIMNDGAASVSIELQFGEAHSRVASVALVSPYDNIECFGYDRNNTPLLQLTFASADSYAKGVAGIGIRHKADEGTIAAGTYYFDIVLVNTDGERETLPLTLYVLGGEGMTYDGKTPDQTDDDANMSRYVYTNIVYDLDGGINAKYNAEAGVLSTDGTGLFSVIPIASPTREGYVFDGWYLSDQRLPQLSTLPVNAGGESYIDFALINSEVNKSGSNIFFNSMQIVGERTMLSPVLTAKWTPFSVAKGEGIFQQLLAAEEKAARLEEQTTLLEKHIDELDAQLAQLRGNNAELTADGDELQRHMEEEKARLEQQFAAEIEEIHRQNSATQVVAVSISLAAGAIITLLLCRLFRKKKS